MHRLEFCLLCLPVVSLHACPCFQAWRVHVCISVDADTHVCVDLEALISSFPKRMSDQGRGVPEAQDSQIHMCVQHASEAVSASLHTPISVLTRLSVSDQCGLLLGVCVHHVCGLDTCTPESVSQLLSPSQLGCVPFSLSHTHTKTHPHMCCVNGEGAVVSASSCVIRLISPQPGRLGPEGSGGGGACPHSPSDKYVFGTAVLKGHGGRGRRRGGLHCAVLLGSSRAQSGLWDPRP